MAQRDPSFLEPLFEAVRGSAVGGSARLLDRRIDRARDRLEDLLATPTVDVAVLESLARDWAGKDFDDRFDAIAVLEESVARLGMSDEERLRANLERRFGRVELRGLGVFPNPSCAIDDVWVEPMVQPSVTNGAQFPTSLEGLTESSPTLLVGPAGSGKSMLLARVAISLARGEQRLRSHRHAFLIEAHRFLACGALTHAAIADAHDLDESFVRTALSNETGLLLLDGLDELPVDEGRAFLSGACALVSGGAALVATSRHTLVLPSGTQFWSWETRPFDATRVEECVRKWALALERSVQRDRERARADAERDSVKVIENLRRRRTLMELAGTPLLCTTLTLLHRFMGRHLPEDELSLYEAWANLLLHEWDSAKLSPGSVVGRLGLPQKRQWLTEIATRLVIEGRSEFTIEDVESPPGEYDSRSMLTEVALRSGVLESAWGRFAFVHKSFRDYFASLAADEAVVQRAARVDAAVLRWVRLGRPEVGDRIAARMLRSDNPVERWQAVLYALEPRDAALSPVLDAAIRDSPDYARAISVGRAHLPATGTDAVSVAIIAGIVLVGAGVAALMAARASSRSEPAIPDEGKRSPPPTVATSPHAGASSPSNVLEPVASRSPAARGAKAAAAQSPSGAKSRASGGRARSPRS